MSIGDRWLEGPFAMTPSSDHDYIAACLQSIHKINALQVYTASFSTKDEAVPSSESAKPRPGRWRTAAGAPAPAQAQTKQAPRYSVAGLSGLGSNMSMNKIYVLRALLGGLWRNVLKNGARQLGCCSMVWG